MSHIIIETSVLLNVPYYSDAVVSVKFS